MNKAQFIHLVASRTKTTKANSSMVIDAALEIIQQAVSEGQDVKLVGFGTFSRFQRKARKGRNLSSGNPLEIPPSSIPKFKAGKDFRKVVKKDQSDLS